MGTEPLPMWVAILLAMLGGFSLSFIVISLILLFPLDALLLGDVLQEAPFNLAKHNQMLASATLQLVSFWFWASVAALGVFFSWWFLRLFR